MKFNKLSDTLYEAQDDERNPLPVFVYKRSEVDWWEVGWYNNCLWTMCIEEGESAAFNNLQNAMECARLMCDPDDDMAFRQSRDGIISHMMEISSL